jgi:hypothetical protein
LAMVNALDTTGPRTATMSTVRMKPVILESKVAKATAPPVATAWRASLIGRPLLMPRLDERALLPAQTC